VPGEVVAPQAPPQIRVGRRRWTSPPARHERSALMIVINGSAVRPRPAPCSSERISSLQAHTSPTGRHPRTWPPPLPSMPELIQTGSARLSVHAHRRSRAPLIRQAHRRRPKYRRQARWQRHDSKVPNGTRHRATAGPGDRRRPVLGAYEFGEHVAASTPITPSATGIRKTRAPFSKTSVTLSAANAVRTAIAFRKVRAPCRRRVSNLGRCGRTKLVPATNISATVQRRRVTHDLDPPQLQRVNVLTYAPGQEHLEVRAGVHPGLSPVPAQIRGHRRTQHTLVGDDNGVTGNRRSSHTSRCVTMSLSTTALGAANPDAVDLGGLVCPTFAYRNSACPTATLSVPGWSMFRQSPRPGA
jgi:hypothetical protein